MTVSSPMQQPIQSEMPYVVHVDDDALTKPLDVNSCEIDSAGWQVGLFGGCSDNCCSCVVPWCFPCLGIGSATNWAWGEGAAVINLIYFAALVLGACVASGLDYEYGKQVHETETLVDDGWWWYYDYTYTVTTNNSYAIASIACSAVYLVSLAVFRVLFRRKLALPGYCLMDVLAALFCSCCVVAQMRTHSKRAATMAKGVDTLPAYNADA